jgi:hypothetical protein
MAQRLKIEYKIRKYENGKEVERKYVRKLNDAMPTISVAKTTK